MDDDWDLNAVVRGCAAGASAANNTTQATFSSSQQDYCSSSSSSSSSTCSQEDPSQIKAASSVQELHDLCKPYFRSSLQEPSQIHFSSQSLPISPLSHLQDPQFGQQVQLRQKQQPFSVSNGSKSGPSHNPTPRSKRRKNHLKKVCHVAAENLSSDMWSWRKYGQKPIKGSPYPRGYYRCSTSKGCMARKQVERNRSDSGMFIVTYTSDHNHPMPTHRNSLAGSTRQKPAETPPASDGHEHLIKPFSQTSPAPERQESSREDLPEVEDDDGDDFSVTDMAVDDDFFEGLEDFIGPEGGDSESDHLPASVQFPWFSNSATTTTAGGG